METWIPRASSPCSPPRAEPDEAGPHWVCTRHADVSALLREERLSVDRALCSAFRREARARGRDPERSMRSLLVLDPPEHTRIRRLVSGAFSPRRCEALEPRLRSVADALLEGTDPAGFDLVERFAEPFPARVIAELLGLDPADHGRFCDWSRALTAPLVGPSDARQLARAETAERELGDFLLRELAARRRDPGGGGDLIAALVEAREDEDCLGDAELLALLRLLLVAGHETTTRLIGTGVAMLIAAGEWPALGREPARLPGAVEELLRLATPIRGIARFAREPLELGGARIERGSRITAWLDAANRDPELFERPEALRVDRDPNPQLAFGHGTHFCLGAGLARTEARVALEALCARYPALRLDESKPRWIASPLVRGLEGLCVRAGSA